MFHKKNIMLTIGNIVTKENINIDNYFNIVDNIININKDLPTLIIGWEDFIKYNFEDVDFIDRTLYENTFWTFSKIERRDKMNIDLYNFEEYCINKFLSNINYTYVDLITFSENKIKKIFSFIKENNSTVYNFKDMYYIYCCNNVFGFNKNIIKYLDYEEIRFTEKLKKITNNYIDDNFINNYSILENIENNKKYIPYLYHAEKENNIVN